MPEGEDIFTRIREDRGSVADIHSAFARFENGVEGHYLLYQRLMLEDDLPLKRAEREYLAVCVSKANRCPYCIGHHGAALEANSGTGIVESRRRVLRMLAETLSRSPWKSPSLEQLFVEVGYDSAQWQHAVMVASYFNMANRMAFAMGLELEPGFQETCR